MTDTGKKLFLYGEDRFINDFSTFFYDLNISGIVGDNIEMENLSPEREVDFTIVICSFSPEKYEDELVKRGFTYGKNYCYGTDIIKTVDHYITGKKTIVFGTGLASEVFVKIYDDLEIAYFVDNSEQKIGTTFMGKEVKSPDALRNEKQGEFFVIIIVTDLYAIKTQLESMGLVSKKDFSYYNMGSCDLSPNKKLRLSTMLEMIMKAEPITDRVCSFAFERADIYMNGNINSCCMSGIDITGNIIMDSYDEWLKSVYLRLLRLMVINGTFVFCNKERCGVLRGDSYDIFPLIDDPKKVSIQNNPNQSLFFTVGHDSRCNLACKCCKKEMKTTLTVAERKSIEYMHERIIEDFLPHCETFHVAGYGDPFFSEYYKELIFNKCKAKNILIQTNGLLFNENDWNGIKGKYSHIQMNVSIDAATAETYKYLRGGSFDQLLKKLRIMSDLRKKGEINVFHLCYVVQKYNYLEMKDFVKLGMELGVDRIVFQRILTNGVQVDEKFEEADISNPCHPENKDFIKMLEDPIFKEEIVAPWFK